MFRIPRTILLTAVDQISSILFFCMYVCTYHLCYSEHINVDCEQSLIVLRADKMYNRSVLSIIVYVVLWLIVR